MTHSTTVNFLLAAQLLTLPVCSQFMHVIFYHKRLPVGFSASLQANNYVHASKHTNWAQALDFTRVNVKLALHSLGNALQFDSLQGAVSVDRGGQAAQCLPDKARHLPYCEDLQQLPINSWERPQEHGLGGTEED